jgi:hypothetical protein
LLLTTDAGFTPTGQGPPESPRTGGSGLEVVAEAGTVTTAQSGPGQWHSVTLLHSFAQPVVVLGPFSYNGGHPSTVRVRNVGATGFEFQLDEWDYLDGSHTEETVAYLVVEAGRHTLEDGQSLEAGLATVSSTLTPVAFAQSFAQAPVVITQVVTTNQAAAVVPRQQSISAGGFEVFLQEQEAGGNPGPETLAWVAMEEGTGTTGSLPYEAGLTGNIVTHAFSALPFVGSFSGTPAFLAAMQTTDGGDAATLRYQALSASGVEVKVEEEQSSDSETNHTTEQVGYLVFAPGLVRGLSGQAAARLSEAKEPVLDEAVRASVEEAALPEQYALEGNYPNPFNPTTTIRYGLPEAGAVRLEVFDVLGRRVAVLVEEEQAAGRYAVDFNGEEFPSGMYLYRLQAGAFVQTATMLLIK